MEKKLNGGGKTLVKKLGWAFVALVLLVIPVFASGCGTDGSDGTNGAQWYYGTDDPPVGLGSNGDLYIDTDDYILYKKEGGSWVLVMTDFGRPGTDGEDGTDGTDGTDGVDGKSSYIGYDGYWWVGEKRTKYQAIDLSDDYVSENTIGLYGNEYFDSYTIDLDTNQVALMSYYMPNTVKTGYSGIVVTQIEVYAEQAGTITIGTASVADVISERADYDGTVTLQNSSCYTLKKGENTLDLGELEVADDETIVLGQSGDTAKLVAYAAVDADDQQGIFTIINSNAYSDTLQTTDGICDKLVVKVNLQETCDSDYTVVAAIEIKETVAKAEEDNASTGIAANNLKRTPYAIIDNSSFVGSYVEYIDMYVKTVSSISEDQHTSVHVYYASDLSTVTTYTLVKTYDFYVKAEDLASYDSTTINDWLRFYCDEEVYVGTNQTLAFDEAIYDSSEQLIDSSKSTVDVVLCYDTYLTVYGTYSFMLANNGRYNFNPMAEIYLRNYESSEKIAAETWQEHVDALQDAENDVELYNILEGLYVSVLGDSISTANGYSNNASYNTTIGDNSYYYSASFSDSTYWKQLIDEYSMVLDVNNSWSGSTTVGATLESSAWYSRCTELDNNSDVAPDIILMFMGTNDSTTSMNSVSSFDSAYWQRIKTIAESVYDENDSTTYPTTFDEAYAVSIYKMIQKYPDAVIFCFTLPQTTEAAIAKNEVITAICEHYGCELLDLYDTVLCTESDTYKSDGLHPNEYGMDVITEALVDALKNYYFN